MRWLATLLWLLASPAMAQGIIPGPPNPVITEYNYTHITTDTTTTVKSSPGVLHAITINTVAATEVVTVYDNTAASGTVIAVITEASGQSPSTVLLDVAFKTGLTIVTATAAGDLTVASY